MNFEPQKFFVGVIDFFSIILPGALLTYLLKDKVGPLLLGDGYQKLWGTEGGMVFAFCAYLIGHFIFLLGSWLLDDHLYDPIRTATYNGQIERLAKGKKLPWKPTRCLARWLIEKNADLAVRQAERIKEHYLDPLGASLAINAFQWCKAKLTLENPVAMATVQRFEADSKFFRSLFVVLCILIPSGLVAKHPAIAVASAPLLALAFLRYVDQRVKATNQAYWYVITMESSRGGALQQSLQPQADGASHAGGVVFRQKDGQVEYLLVQAKSAPQELVLPKGHVEPGERMQTTAVREVREETGVWARIKCQLNTISFSIDGDHIKVQYYLMEALEEGEPSDQRRKHEWLPSDKAPDRVSHKESKELLRHAEQKRKKHENGVRDDHK